MGGLALGLGGIGFGPGGGLGRGPERPWTPAALDGLGLWLTAKQPGSLTVDTRSGTQFVTAWADLSGNGRHFTQSSAALQPSLSAINGEPALYFDGDWLTGNVACAGLFRNAPGATWAGACRIDDTAASRVVCMASRGGSGTQTRFHVNLRSPAGPTGVNLQFRRADTDPGVGFDAVRPGLALSMVASVDHVSREVRLWLNGNLALASATGLASGYTSDTDSAVVVLGAFGTSHTSPFIGAVGEILALPRPVSTQEAVSMSAWFADQWGLSGPS